jgi:hypothetical protein
LEDGVNRGLIERGMALRLLAKFKVPMTPESKVYRGEPEPLLVQQKKLI